MKRSIATLTTLVFLTVGAFTQASQVNPMSTPVETQENSYPVDSDTCWVAPEWRND